LVPWIFLAKTIVHGTRHVSVSAGRKDSQVLHLAICKQFCLQRCAHRAFLHSSVACVAMSRPAVLRFLLCTLGRCFQPGL
jgi:hypothetical protein